MLGLEIGMDMLLLPDDGGGVGVLTRGLRIFVISGSLG